MPAPTREAAISGRPQQLSTQAMVLCSACFLTTLFGASAVTFSFSLVLQAHAGSSEYWLISGVLLVIWFATLINMHRIALAAVLAER